MGDFLSMDNILTGDEAASLFEDIPEDVQASASQSDEKEETNEKTETEDNKTTEVNSEELFDEDTPESVGSEEHTGNQENTTSDEDSTSPKNNFYSSIAGALKEEGILPDLDDSEINKITEPEQFRDLIDKLIKAGVDEVHKRVYDALNAGVEPSVIKQYENTLSYLQNISEDLLNDESERGELLRRQLLQQDFLNRGYSQERAVKMAERLFNSGEDIEEAKNALQGNKEYFSDKYKKLLADAKAEEENNKKAIQRQTEELKKDILNSDKIFGDIPIDKRTRQRVFENISRPVYKDPETGEYYTALQKYRKDNENDFVKNVGILFTLTDGFTNMDKIIQPSAKKEVKKKLRELEHTINNTARNSSGTLKYVNSGSGKQSQSLFDNGFMIDIN